MNIETTTIAGVLRLSPTPHRDDRGLFTRTFDTELFDDALARFGAGGDVDSRSFVQDSQSRSSFGVLRGMHGRIGLGEAKLVRVAHGAVTDVLVDARPDSPTFGTVEQFRLDDVDFVSLYVPPGLLHGFQATTEVADMCYRISRPHDPTEDVSVRYDDPDLAIEWPVPQPITSAKDAAAGTWRDLARQLQG